jgi:hypothetical protein
MCTSTFSKAFVGSGGGVRDAFPLGTGANPNFSLCSALAFFLLRLSSAKITNLKRKRINKFQSSLSAWMRLLCKTQISFCFHTIVIIVQKGQRSAETWCDHGSFDIPCFLWLPRHRKHTPKIIQQFLTLKCISHTQHY